MSEIKSVKQLVEYAAKSYGDKDFCRYYIGTYAYKKSYNEFYEDALAVARYIRHINPKRMHIAFIGKTNYEYIACLTGMIFSGNVVVPFAPDITVDEATKLFDDADIEMLFCEEEVMATALEIQKRTPALKKIVSLGDIKWFANIFEAYNSESEYAGLEQVDIDVDACALIIYTSGTTGDRKGVMLSNHN
ncbi:MAG: acyl--CoA ligase, partial [Clostridia bacterium]|nr:acyl--CoA ligase [Clostridia bacterium]